MSLPATLAHLTALNLIRSQAEEDYAFGHVLIQEAAYQSLLKADRRTLHRHVGEVLANVPTTTAATLAAHFREAGELARAGHYFLQAGDEALANNANVEAEGHYQQAVQTWGLLAVRPEAQLARAWKGMGQAQARQSRFAAAQASWHEARLLFEHLGATDEWGQVTALIVNAAGFGGDWARAWVWAQQWVQASATHPETAGLAALLHCAAVAAQRNALPDQARALRERALGVAERTHAISERVQILTQQGYMFIGQGRIAEATTTLTETLALAEQAHLPPATIPIYAYLAQLARDARRDLPMAQDQFLRGVTVAQRLGVATRQLFNLAFAVEVVYGRGLAGQAEVLWQQVVVVRAQLPDPRVLVPAVSLVEAGRWHWLGQWAAAEAAYETVALETQRRQELQYLAIALWLHGYHWLVRGAGPAAQAKLLAALPLWQESATNYLTLYYNLSAAHSLLGEVATARHWLAEGQQRAPHTRPYWRDEEARLEAEALLALAEGRTPEAWRFFAAAATQVVSFGGYGLLADVWALWAWACEQQGLATQAQQLWQHIATLRAAAAQDAPAPAVAAIMQQLPVF